MKRLIKVFLFYIMKQFACLYRVFPISKNKILFVSFNGKSINGNPKYIYDSLMESKEVFDCFWVYNEVPDKEKIRDSRYVKMLSLRFLYIYSTSRLVITNDSLYGFLRKRAGQIFIQTWHGGGSYKKVGKSTSRNSKSNRKELVNSFSVYDYFLSSCNSFSKNVIKDGFDYSGSILDYGLPRNDVLIKNDLNITNLKHKLGLPLDKMIVLYAPTFRDSSNIDIYNLNISEIMKQLSNKFNKDCVFIVKYHHKIKEMVHFDDVHFDFSMHENTQEILYISDILITDYSSIIWDFSLMNKPCFLYLPDYEEYSSKQGFYIDIKEFPGLVAYSLSELYSNINQFDEIEYRKKIHNHHLIMESFEKGNALEQTISLINRIMRG